MPVVPKSRWTGDSIPPRAAYSPAEFAQLLGIGRTKLYDLLKDGKVSSVKIGKQRKITDNELQRVLTFGVE